MSNPPSLPPLFRDQRRVDSEHLKLLSIFHFVVAGLAVLGLGFLFLHYAVMSTVMTNPEAWKTPTQHAPPPQELFTFFKWFYLGAGVLLILASIANVLSGLFILRRRNRMFSLVVAGLNCLQMPFGTLLGVFTIIVLVRDSVREQYDAIVGREGGDARLRSG